jgi:hypothetical protein
MCCGIRGGGGGGRRALAPLASHCGAAPHLLLTPSPVQQRLPERDVPRWTERRRCGRKLAESSHSRSSDRPPCCEALHAMVPLLPAPAGGGVHALEGSLGADHRAGPLGESTCSPQQPLAAAGRLQALAGPAVSELEGAASHTLPPCRVRLIAHAQ